MKTAPEKLRIDKWLWAVRIFKTRSMAADACEKGKILIDDAPVKASRMIKGGEIIHVRKGAFRLCYQVLQLTENRLAAKSVAEFCSDCTPAEELERMKLHAMAVRAYRNNSEGRPTKKERRALDDFLDW
ncbi:MAG: RNA-binding S4 domain-containing protein [Bacteroidetes bacterium]|jgi:ribosome-associated heat shock protein Hsp15|nr:RNA-binding S4 domain-containing protein [Bacteroidota bacterium]